MLAEILQPWYFLKQPSTKHRIDEKTNTELLLIYVLR